MNSTSIQFPQPGAFYRHFKGDAYFIIGIAHYSAKLPMNPSELFVLYTADISNFILMLSQYHVVPVKHSETEEIYGAYLENGNWLIIPIVWAEQSSTWIRPLNHFMEIVSDESGENYPRFGFVSDNLKGLLN